MNADAEQATPGDAVGVARRSAGLVTRRTADPLLLELGRPSTVSANLYTISPSGRGLKQLTRARGGSVQNLSATFSPDGRWITFARTPGIGKGGNADSSSCAPTAPASGTSRALRAGTAVSTGAAQIAQSRRRAGPAPMSLKTLRWAEFVSAQTTRCWRLSPHCLNASIQFGSQIALESIS